MKARPIAVLASGPSLTDADIDLLRRHRVPFVAVNSTYFKAPDCVAIVAGDYRWWKAYGDKVGDVIRRSRSRKSEQSYGAAVMRTRVKGSYNSGMCAVEWVVQKGYSPVILLGMDCSLKNGSHHHGDHKDTPNPTESRIKHWHRQWEAFKKAYPKASVVNCSRYTELESFPVVPLETVLCGLT